MPDFPTTGHLGVKLCGFTRREDSEAAIAAGADALGFNFWPRSKRHLPLEKARQWLPSLSTSKTALVAVVVNADSLLLEQIITSRLFHSIQLHGDETPDDVSFLMERGLRVIKALQVKDESSLDCIALYACTDILLDAYNPALYGGSGESFPWHLAELARLRHPDKRIILSGGLNPDNVAEAVSQVRPAAVDVASGVESEPGIKDPAKMAAFVRNARSVLVA